MKRAIEDSFPIVEINRLAAPERNAFKPIYQMHKWFARRASCVFRAILLGALKPLPIGPDGQPTMSGAQLIMDEFYKDHTNDPDTNGKVILDPFMGGGTTVVEALRLGCKVVGIDLNPVAWFIVKTETESVDIPALEAAFDRLANRIVSWSGKPLRETLLDLYKTTCPSCGGSADIIYTFWVKKAPCTSATCSQQTPLFSDYIVASKSPSIFYIEDCECPECSKTFDWEVEPAALVPQKQLMVNAGKGAAGIGRGNSRWAYGYAVKTKAGIRGAVECPWCGKTGMPKKALFKPKRKKVELSVLFCPKCEEVWQYRGPLPESVKCPKCQHEYDPNSANVPDSGKFVCSCGNGAKIIDAIRKLPEDTLLPMQAYAVECQCPRCEHKPGNDASEPDTSNDLFNDEENRLSRHIRTNEMENTNLVWKNSGKFIKSFNAADLALFQNACALWDKHKDVLLYPKSGIPVGEKTKSGLLAHHYRYWHQMFNPRQLLALGTIIGAIAQEKGRLRDQLLLCLSATTDTNNVFTRYMAKRESQGGQTAQGVFARHDFQPKITVCEQNIWGLEAGGIGTFVRRFWQTLEGIGFGFKTSDVKYTTKKGKRIREVVVCDPIYSARNKSNASVLLCRSSRHLPDIGDGHADFVVTDPPYSDNVNYSELADFYYVWQRLILSAEHNHFAPEVAPKADEVIKNLSRGKGDAEFADDLTGVFREAHRVLKENGLLVFTFHHAEGSAWESLLQSILNSGFEIVSIYPVQSEGESSLHLMDKQAISYDLIHVCRKRPDDAQSSTRSWAGIRHAIRDAARTEIALIESGRFGNETLAPTDRNIILIGKCLQLYSAHCGKIVDHEGKPVPLHAALEAIRMMVDQLTDSELRLPHELEDIDAPSYVYLTCLCDRTEIKSDEVHKATRGICEPATLHEHQLVIKGRAKRGRTYEVKAPLDRLDLLRLRFASGVRTRGAAQTMLFDEELTPAIAPNAIFIDHVHFLIALAQNGESVVEWLETFSGLRPQLRAAFDFLERRNRAFAEPIRKILGLLDERTLFNRTEGPIQ